jgi:hypothetical protein
MSGNLKSYPISVDFQNGRIISELDPNNVLDINTITYNNLRKVMIERDSKLVLEGATDYCYAPEWFANKYIFLRFHPKTRELIIHNGACAKVYADGELIYSYQLFDKIKFGGKKFGGDTWGSITNNEDSVFFGGFAYADTSLNGSSLTFVNKYSHIHRIASDGRTIDLLWYDGPGTATSYKPEVTDMLYSPKDDAIYFTRGDGGTDIWKLDLSTMYVTQVTNTGKSLLKMELFNDMIITGGPDGYGSGGHIVIYNLKDGTANVVTSATGVFIDGTPRFMNGQVVQYFENIYIFGSGAVINYEPKYNAFFQFPFFRFKKANKVGGRRSQKAYVNGIPVIAVNQYDGNAELRTPASVLVRLDHPSPQIIMPMGYVSGLETDGKYLYTAVAPQNTLYSTNSVNYQPGRGGVFAMPVSSVMSKPLAPVEFQDEIYNWTAGDYYLGVPINGFSKRVLKVRAPAAFTLKLFFHYLWPAATDVTAEENDVSLSAGMNTIDLSSYDGLVAATPSANVSGYTLIKLILEP